MDDLRTEDSATFISALKHHKKGRVYLPIIRIIHTPHFTITTSILQLLDII